MLTSLARRSLESGLASRSAKREISNLIDFALANTTGNVFFVDDSGTDSPHNGKSKDTPFASIDYAIGRCTANHGDIIFVMPGHNEDLGDGHTIDIDKAGVSVIGLGSGSARPRFDYNHANASINVQASGCVLKNLTFLPSVATVAIGVDVEDSVTDTKILDCEFLPGEDGAGADEFVLGIDVKAGCTRTEIVGLRYSHHASADGAASCVKLTGASDRVRIADCWLQISGTAAVACINGDTTLSTRLLIDDCVLTTDSQPGVEFLTGTTGVIQDVLVFADLATIDAATVADGMAHNNVKYVEVGNEADTQVKTPSIDD